MSLPFNVICGSVEVRAEGERIRAVQDPEDSSKYNLGVDARVSVHIPPPPEGGIKKIIAGYDPIIVPSEHITEYTISNLKDFYIQQIEFGAEGDPTEKGSKVTILFFDGTNDHIFTIFYITGFSQSFQYSGDNITIDGTQMTGDGSTKKIRIKRTLLSGQNREIFAVVRGYEL